MTAARAPSDVRYLEWSGKDGFGRARAEWLQLHRWDTRLSPATVVVLSEIAGRMAHDRDWAWPSIPRLAAELGWSDPTVKRAIAQAIERGWLIIEKRGFGGSNHYAMAISPAVQAWVLDERGRRLANFVETRPPSLRSKMIPLGDDAIEINSDPSMRSKMIPHSDQKRSLNEINSDPLSLSLNLTSEPHHRSSTEGLGETEQDEAQGRPSLPSKSQIPVLLDEDEADEALRIEEDVIAAIGKVAGGDLARGRQLARRLGRQRLQHLFELAHDRGVGGAGPDIFAAAQAALQIESTSQIEVTT